MSQDGSSIRSSQASAVMDGSRPDGGGRAREERGWVEVEVESESESEAETDAFFVAGGFCFLSAIYGTMLFFPGTPAMSFDSDGVYAVFIFEDLRLFEEDVDEDDAWDVVVRGGANASPAGFAAAVDFDDAPIVVGDFASPPESSLGGIVGCENANTGSDVRYVCRGVLSRFVRCANWGSWVLGLLFFLHQACALLVNDLRTKASSYGKTLL
mmetsp:Transcript_54699/g.163480  ORF Transcript_54699/g.163480 Transcript_54699/m.163480 type:complete len:212 (-) Transcript_54699:295-930(-)